MDAMTLLVDRRGAELSISQNTKAVCLRYPNDEVKILFERLVVALEQIASSYQGKPSEKNK